MRFVVAVLLASVCFGTTGTAQALGPDADPLSIGAARLVIGGGALGLIAVALHVVGRRRGAVGTPAAPSSDGTRRLPTWAVVGLGAAGVLCYQPAFFAGTAANGVAVGTVVALGSAPVLTGALDWTLTRRYPGGRWLVATAIATVGVAILAVASGGAADGASGGADASAAGSADASGSPMLGLLASLGAGASYAVYTIAAKTLQGRGWAPTGSVGGLFGVAAVASLPILLLTDASWLATPEGLAMAAWLGLVTTTLAYVLFGAGLAGLAPATVSTLTLAEPLTAGLLGVLLLGEHLSPASAAGLGVLALGIVVLVVGTRAPRSGRRPASPAPVIAAAPPRPTPHG